MATIQPTLVEPQPGVTQDKPGQNPRPNPVAPSSLAKRKYNEALNLLDDATGQTVTETSPQPPSKRPRTSIYATFAKYGIGTTSKQAHHSRTSSSGLARLLQRAKFQSGRVSNDEDILKNEYPDYNPTSRTDFLGRLQTFKLMTYSSKPPEIDSVAAARHGWSNGEGKESLVCTTCGATWVVAPKPSNTESVQAWVKEQTKSLLDNHKSACPWKVRHCEPSIYTMPIPSPSSLAKELLQRSQRVETVLENIQIKHPLNQSQVRTITSAISSAKALARTGATTDNIEVPLEDDNNETISETASVVAFFGWDYVSPSNPSQSISRASTPSPFPGRPIITGPSPLSRPYKNTMLTCHLCQRQVGLWAFTIPSQIPRPINGSSLITTTKPPAANRRISSSFTSSMPKQFDILKEHRTHCPYVVKATYVPSLVVSQSQQLSQTVPTKTISSLNPSKHASTVDVGMDSTSHFYEGWKAQLGVLSRSQWRRASGLAALGVPSNAATPSGASAEQPGPMQAATSSNNAMEVDQVSQIVNTVKTKHGGGRELLRFVKGLLG